MDTRYCQTVEFIPAEEYTWLCDKCRQLLSTITIELSGIELPDIDATNQEYPCDYMYDHRLFCGQYTCINGSKH